jgi:hypothetical protein
MASDGQYGRGLMQAAQDGRVKIRRLLSAPTSAGRSRRKRVYTGFITTTYIGVCFYISSADLRRKMIHLTVTAVGSMRSRIVKSRVFHTFPSSVSQEVAETSGLCDGFPALVRLLLHLKC